MTSQVAVYNLLGMAIASDTVATQNSDRGSKTTGNAEKIYEIGPGHKLVVLHYGSTGLNDLHHQFHFNEWARTVSKPFSKLSDYIKAYIKWSNNGPKLHSAESEVREMSYYIYDHMSYLSHRLHSESPEAPSEKKPSKADEEQTWNSFVERIFKDGLAHLRALDHFDSFTDAEAREAIKAAKIDLNEIIKDAFGEQILSPKAISILKRSAPLVLSRKQSMPTDSYLAFAGYGDKDPFAGVQIITIRGIYGGSLKYHVGELVQIGTGSDQTQISTFAQSEAIDAFARGYNNDILMRMKWGVRTKAQNALGDAAGEIPRKLAEDVVDDIAEYSWRTYTQPVLKRVAGMNLHSLAELAKSLVGMQATFSEAQDGPVSVGGLIEVVTIDRIDGVRWKTRLPR